MKMISTRGDESHWETSIPVSEPKSPSEIIDFLRSRIKAATSHTRGAVTIVEPGRQRPSSVSQIRWTFIDDRGIRWQGIGIAAPFTEQKNESTLTLKLARSSAHLRT